MNAVNLAYKPLGILLGAAAGVLAGTAFERTWRALSGTEGVPGARDEDRAWSEVLAAAAMQGAIFAVVKAAVDRAGAQGVRKVTGRWPG